MERETKKKRYKRKRERESKQYFTIFEEICFNYLDKSRYMKNKKDSDIFSILKSTRKHNLFKN